MKRGLDLVVVEWDDANGPTFDGWAPIDRAHADLSLVRIRSVGWLLNKDACAVKLVADLGHGGDADAINMVQRTLTIPRKGIVSMTTLRKAKR